MTLIILSAINGVLLAWIIYSEYKRKSINGLLTANHLALNRINARLDVFQDAEWQKYSQ